MSKVHAHEIMHMMIDSNLSYTKESLINTIIEKFGAETLFHSCSKEGMDAYSVVDFLEERGKFVPKESGFTTESSKMCNHEH